MIKVLLFGLLSFCMSDSLLSAIENDQYKDPKPKKHHSDSILKQDIVTLIDRKNPSPTGNAHDYVSYAPYWWPDPGSANGLPYIRKDGHYNRYQMNQGTKEILGKMFSTVNALTKEWSKTRDKAYSDRAAQWLRAWFVNPSTVMTPNLEFSQIHLGSNNNRGNTAGVLEGRNFAYLVDDITVLKESTSLTDDDIEHINQWFKSYHTWLMTSKLGKAEHAATNNHGSWFLVQAIAISRYLKNDVLAHNLALEDKARIDNQIKPDGRQPLEIARVDGLGYCVFNVEAQLGVAKLSSSLGVDLWHYTSPNGGSIPKALAFLKAYNDDPSKWKTSQLKRLKPGFLDEVLSEAAVLDKKS
jgi:Alginate lyase